MFKNLLSILLAIVGGIVVLKLIGFLVSIMFVAIKFGIIIVIAVPLFFLIKKLLTK